MKIRHIVFSLLPAIALADSATTVPDDEPWHPPLPEELLSPQSEQAGLPATARPVVSYNAPKDEEQTWLKLFYIRGTDAWPDVFRRMAAASHDKDMQMCHGYALWLKGQSILHLRYDDDLSLSGIHADGHAYGVLFVEFSPYGIRVCPMAGYDLSGKNGGVCWQDSATRLWSWAEAEQFWAELPKLLRSDKGRATSAQDTAVKREVATKGQRMVIFWAPAGYPANSWWPSFARLHAEVGDRRFSLIAPDGLKLWTDVTVPTVRGTAPAPAQPTPAPATPPTAAPTPSAATPPTAAPASTAARPAPSAPAAAPPAAKPASPATPAGQHQVPEQLQPATGAPEKVAVPASVRPWELTGEPAPDAATPAPAPSAPAAASPAAKPASPATPAGQHQVPEQLQPATGAPEKVAVPASVRPWELTGEPAPAAATPAAAAPATKPTATAPKSALPTAPKSAAPAAQPTTPEAPPAAPAESSSKPRTLHDIHVVLP